MREEPQSPYEMCIYCKQSITDEHKPFRRLPNGKAAHLKCYIEHIDDEENEADR